MPGPLPARGRALQRMRRRIAGDCGCVRSAGRLATRPGAEMRPFRNETRHCKHPRLAAFARKKGGSPPARVVGSRAVFSLELAGATKRYGRRHALASVDLAVPQGTSVGLLGANGAGKTTALRLLLGFARPTRGAARLRGLDPFDAASRRGVGYLPERLRLPQSMTLQRFLHRTRRPRRSRRRGPRA